MGGPNRALFAPSFMSDFVTPSLGCHWLRLVVFVLRFYFLVENSFWITVVAVLIVFVLVVFNLVDSVYNSSENVALTNTPACTAVFMYVLCGTVLFVFVPSLGDGTSSCSRCTASPKCLARFTEQGKRARFCLGTLFFLCVSPLADG